MHKSFKEFVMENIHDQQHQNEYDPVYEAYCSDIELVSEYIFGGGGLSDHHHHLNEEYVVESLQVIKKEIIEIFKEIKKTIVDSGLSVRLSAQDIIRAFKSKNIYEALKYFGFSLRNALNAVDILTSSTKNAFYKLFDDLRKVNSIKDFDERSKKIDEILERHPIAKKLTGPVVAGMLLMTWLNMTFIGNFKYDMDISTWFKALKGDFSVHDLFISSKGMTMLSFLMLGVASGGAVSFAWLGSTVANLSLALVYVIMVKTGVDKRVLNKVKAHINKKIQQSEQKRLQTKMQKKR